MTIKLYNTDGRSLQEFIPLSLGKVGMYTCGPTVYNFAHIGNLRTFVFEDVLKKILELNGLEVNHVMNITDVGHLVSDGDDGEDKMEAGARREGKTVWEIAQGYTDAFMLDMDNLNIAQPSTWCKATDHIQEQIDMVKILEDKGIAYPLADGIYCDTSKVVEYGRMANLDIEGMQAGARVAMIEGKRNFTDFALWKFSPENEKRLMEWESPWGVGFPGWHIECSAMSMKYLGEQFDIHCGGIDHISIHHTNEIAQTEMVTGKKWVNYWLHGEFLVLDKGKMSKSGGGFITVQTLIDKGYDPLAYRYFLLNAHYRSQLTFSFEALDAAAQGYKNLKSRAQKLLLVNALSTQRTDEYLEVFLAHCNTDMNMPRALASLWDVIKNPEVSDAEKRTLVEYADEVLGLKLLEKEEVLTLDEKIETLIAQRNQAREDKNWGEADRIRDDLLAQGIALLDTPEGVSWTKA